MPESRQYSLVKIVLDIALLALVLSPCIIFPHTLQPSHRGFFCDDESIRYPSKKSTISPVILLTTTILLPCFLIAANEYFSHVRNKGKRKPKFFLTVLEKPIPPFVYEIYKQIGVFMFGLCVVVFTTGVGKLYVGRLRPNFLQTCKPNMTALCDNVDDKYYYVEKYECLNKNAYEVLESRISFPSGHASMSGYAMFYLVFYFQGRLFFEGSKLVKPFCQFIFMMMTLFCCLTRVMDNKHHWTDVFVGFVLGVTSAAITISYISDIFIEAEPEDQSCSEVTINKIPVLNYLSMDLERH